MKKYILLLIITFLFNSCYYTIYHGMNKRGGDYVQVDNLMESWLGETQTKLTETYGPPHKIKTYDDRTKIYYYHYSRGGYTAFREFYISSGVIWKYDWQGI